jgi:ribosomal protein S18 acetylase RimI-like enzyme
MPMEINQAKPNDLIEILFLLRVCTLDMNSKGLKHWNSTFPGTEIIQSDLKNGSIYMVKDKGVCKGMVTLKDHEPEDYKDVAFRADIKKPLYLQNMAVHPKWQGKGIALLMVDFAQKFARDRGFDSIRLDVFKTSEGARQLYEKQHFTEVASFHSSFQKIPFICYEKHI